MTTTLQKRLFISLLTGTLFTACAKTELTILNPHVREACHAPLRTGKPAGYEPSEWSLGLFHGPSPIELSETARTNNPILTASDVTDRTARFVCDPFFIFAEQRWHLFFEIMNCGSEQADIGYAWSTDLKHWEYEKVVLDEPFHLSYPYVFEHQGVFYMIPETRKAQSIRLYEAVSFPHQWKFKQTLVEGNFADSSIVQYQGRWWIFAVQGGYSLAVMYADTLNGPWQKHKLSPFYVDDKSKTRPGGRMIPFDGKLVRFAQDNRERYGHRVRAFIIDALTPDEFSEHEIPSGTLLSPAGAGWRASAMHHVDPQRLSDGSWIAVVDGAGSSPAVKNE